MATLIVTDNPGFWRLDANVEVVPARDYLTGDRFVSMRRTKVFNLCRSYGYQSLGYYVSLLAEARGHKPIPSITTIQDLRLTPVVRAVTRDMEDLIQKALAEVPFSGFSLDVYFGRSVDPRYNRLTRALYNSFPAPFLRARFDRTDDWQLQGVRPVATNEIPEDHKAFVLGEAARYFSRPSTPSRDGVEARFDLAILTNDEEVDAPSDDTAIQKFIRAAAAVGLEAELISRDDFGRLAEFDALFIRETTRVNHHTYRFSRRAEAEGLIVMDSPESILKCSNKVYLAELLTRHGLPTPKTVVVDRDRASRIADQIGFPCVLKKPDSSFSAGVVKAANTDELGRHLKAFFEESELIVAQEFVPSSFDWRVGVLDRRVLYACRYHMVEGHWQIQKAGRSGWRRYGKAEAVPLDEVPARVLDAGLGSASLIGDGLYGVDIKQIGDRVMVMEVNDNPSIESGVEDVVTGDAIYAAVMRYFLDRLEGRGRAAEATSK
jgi:glutathione synthase/RimK-type ligase-like ATP-grasp enzyme